MQCMICEYDNIIRPCAACHRHKKLASFISGGSDQPIQEFQNCFQGNLLLLAYNSFEELRPLRKPHKEHVRSVELDVEAVRSNRHNSMEQTCKNPPGFFLSGVEEIL